MNFNDWGYRADVEAEMQMLEIGNGAYSYYVWTEEEYLKALDYGWKTARATTATPTPTRGPPITRAAPVSGPPS